MTLHWELIPLLATLGCAMLAGVIEPDNDFGPFTFISGIVTSISLIFYILLGIVWLVNNVNII